MNLSSIFSGAVRIRIFSVSNDTQQNNNKPVNNTENVIVAESSGSSKPVFQQSKQAILFKSELNKMLKEYSVQKAPQVGYYERVAMMKYLENNNSAPNVLDMPNEEKEILEDTNILELFSKIDHDKEMLIRVKKELLSIVEDLNNPIELLFLEKIKPSHLHERCVFNQSVLFCLLVNYRFNLVSSSIQNQLGQGFSWDPHLLLSLNQDISKLLPSLILDLKDSIKFCDTLESLLNNFQTPINIHFLSRKKAIIIFCENTPFTSSHSVDLEGNKKLHEIRSSLEEKSIIPSKEYFHDNLVKYKNNYENLLNILNEIHPCNLNAYILVQDCLFLYQVFTSSDMKYTIQEILFTGEFHCFIEKMKNTCINIIKTLLPFARDAKKFFGTESFGKENESHLKEIINPQDNPYASYENDLRKKLEEQWNEAEKELLETQKKLQKEEQIKKSNLSKTSTAPSNNKKNEDRSISVKIENNNNQACSSPTERKPSRKEEKQKNREQLERQRQESQQQKEENLKKLNPKKDLKVEDITLNLKIESSSINEAKNQYLIPSIKDLNEKILSPLNNNNQGIFKALFDIDQLEITHHNILNLAEIISELLSQYGYDECAENFLNDINKHIHPNHGTGQGSVMTPKHKYCIRTYFILSGIMPLNWEPSLENLQAFSYYEQKMKALKEKKEPNNTNK